MTSEVPGTANPARRFAVRGPDLYRGNIFRVTGLPADATPQMIRRQREKFRVSFEVGTPPPSTKGLFALDPPPDQSAVQAAFEGFRDPQRRLVDELFWFWRAEVPPDAASANSVDVYGDHDRAVEAHCVALDLEHTGRQRPLTQEERRRRDTCWSEAARRWAALDGTPQIWERLRDRVTEIDDPRLTVDAVDDILDDLPIRLVTIHAELALELGQRNVDDAQRQRRLIDQVVNEAQLDNATVDAALRAVVAPTLVRIETTCEAARSAASKNPADGCTPGTQALNQLRPALDTVSAILTRTHPTVRAARDQLASTLNHCAIRQENVTTGTDSRARAGFTAVLELLKEAEKFACMAMTTNQIRNNIDIIARYDALQHGQAYRQGAPSRNAPSTIGPAPDPRTGREIFAELRRDTRGPWSYIDQLCQEGRPDLAHDALALWGNYLAKNPATTRQVNTLLLKPAPFVAEMKRPPRRAMTLGCGVGCRTHLTVGEGHVMAIQYLTLFFVPLIPIAAYLVSGDPPHTLDFVGKVPLGMGLRYWRKLLTVVAIVTLTILIFDGGAVFTALLLIVALRIGIQVYKMITLYHNIRRIAR